ncbi:hypothetical protein GGR54DRAFT_508385 [Hypoxylon sp. NC1633]|nr:hypothetical protein GGR54DRAFT_508385 [Hypoxylon sp. NC1633]
MDALLLAIYCHLFRLIESLEMDLDGSRAATPDSVRTISRRPSQENIRGRLSPLLSSDDRCVTCGYRGLAMNQEPAPDTLRFTTWACQPRSRER